MGEVEGGSAPLGSHTPNTPSLTVHVFILRWRSRPPGRRRAASWNCGRPRGKVQREERLGSHQESHPALVLSACVPRPAQGSLGRPSPSPSPALQLHQHGPQLHAAWSSRRPPNPRSVFFRFCSQALAIPAETGVSGAGAGPAEAPLAPAPRKPLGGGCSPSSGRRAIQRRQ